MGNYITAAQVESRMGATLLANLLAGISSGDRTAYTNEAIVRAEGMVDIHLSTRYSTPVASSGFVQEAALRAVEVELHGRSPGRDIPDRVRKNWESIEKTLERIADGKAGLPTGTASISSPATIADYSESAYTSMGRF
jgi:phage gp36-like protein